MAIPKATTRAYVQLSDRLAAGRDGDFQDVSGRLHSRGYKQGK